MADLLVKLYDLPDDRLWLEQLKHADVRVHRAMACDKHRVVQWVQKSFDSLWASECDVAFCRQPVSCHLATRKSELLGFACYDCAMMNFFGPVGVMETERGQGIGTALLLKSLHAMAAVGYAYAIVGDAGSTGFYEKTVGAQAIPGSSPGIYGDRLQSR